jgi:Domain of unknown function (DUF4190)
MSQSNGPGAPPPPPPPPPPGGQWQPAPGGPVGPTKNNGMAIAALVCGIAGFLCLIPGVLGIVFGFMAKSQIRQSNGAQTGDGMATAGIVLGFIWVGLTIVFLALSA